MIEAGGNAEVKVGQASGKAQGDVNGFIVIPARIAAEPEAVVTKVTDIRTVGASGPTGGQGPADIADPFNIGAAGLRGSEGGEVLVERLGNNVHSLDRDIDALAIPAIKAIQIKVNLGLLAGDHIVLAQRVALIEATKETGEITRAIGCTTGGCIGPIALGCGGINGVGVVRRPADRGAIELPALGILGREILDGKDGRKTTTDGCRATEIAGRVAQVEVVGLAGVSRIGWIENCGVGEGSTRTANGELVVGCRQPLAPLKCRLTGADVEVEAVFRGREAELQLGGVIGDQVGAGNTGVCQQGNGLGCGWGCAVVGDLLAGQICRGVPGSVNRSQLDQRAAAHGQTVDAERVCIGVNGGDLTPAAAVVDGVLEAFACTQIGTGVVEHHIGRGHIGGGVGSGVEGAFAHRGEDQRRHRWGCGITLGGGASGCDVSSVISNTEIGGDGAFAKRGKILGGDGEAAGAVGGVVGSEGPGQGGGPIAQSNGGNAAIIVDAIDVESQRFVRIEK